MGVSVNVALWLTTPSVFWMWWNMTGLVAAVAVTMLVSRITAPPSPEQIEKYTLQGAGMLEDERKWIKVYATLLAYFLLILGAAIGVGSLA